MPPITYILLDIILQKNKKFSKISEVCLILELLVRGVKVNFMYLTITLILLPNFLNLNGNLHFSKLIILKLNDNNYMIKYEF